MNKKGNNSASEYQSSNRKEEITPVGDKLWKLPEDDDVDVDEVYDRPIIPGTAGVEL